VNEDRALFRVQKNAVKRKKKSSKAGTCMNSLKKKGPQTGKAITGEGWPRRGAGHGGDWPDLKNGTAESVESKGGEGGRKKEKNDPAHGGQISMLQAPGLKKPKPLSGPKASKDARGGKTEGGGKKEPSPKNKPTA